MSTRPINPYHVLRGFVRQHPTQKAAAKALGISPPYLHDLLHKRRAISTRLLGKLGLRSVPVHIETARRPHGPVK